MIIIKNINGTPRCLIGGRVVRYAEGSGAALNRVVNIWLDDNTEVAFWNHDNRMLADRIKAMKVKVGSFISVLVTFKDDTFAKANAINFMYNGVWSFPRETPIPSSSGIVTEIHTEKENETTVILDNQKSITFKNPVAGTGYRFADRILSKAVVGERLTVSEKDGAIANFKIGDGEWEIQNSVYAIIGKVSFMDEGTTPTKEPYIRLNQRIYQGRDKDGLPIYAPAYTYFDDKRIAGMIGRIKDNVKPSQNVAVVCRKNSSGNIDNLYSGYYFVPLD